MQVWHLENLLDRLHSFLAMGNVHAPVYNQIKDLQYSGHFMVVLILQSGLLKFLIANEVNRGG